MQSLGRLEFEVHIVHYEIDQKVDLVIVGIFVRNFQELLDFSYGWENVDRWDLLDIK